MIKSFLVLFLIFGCSSSIKDPSIYKSWGYQLQNYTPEKITQIYDSSNTLWVVDYSILDVIGKDKLKLLKKNGNTILCYMSIGEAEKYRFYWNYLNKKLIHKKNKLWGSFVMRFWEPEWQKFFFKDGEYGKSYLNRIIEAGFDGVYLDIVDGFYHFKDKKKSGNRMVDFIVKIKNFSTNMRKGFLVFPQNATSLLDYSTKLDEYFAHIDGIGLESVFFRGKKYEGNSYNPDKWVLKHLDEYRKRKVPMFNIEYISKAKDIKKYNKIACEKGIVPLVSDRKLTGKLQILK